MDPIGPIGLQDDASIIDPRLREDDCSEQHKKDEAQTSSF